MSYDAHRWSNEAGPPSRGGGSHTDHRPSWADSYAEYLYDDSVAFTSVNEDDDGETCLRSVTTMETRRSLATMDTRTFRRIREQRREARFGGGKGSSKNSSRDDKNKRKGGDAAGSRDGRSHSSHPSRRSARSSCSSRGAFSDGSPSLHSISLGTASIASGRGDDSTVSGRGSDRSAILPRRVAQLAATLLLSLGLVAARTGMDLVWLMTKGDDRTESLGRAKRRLDAGDWSYVDVPPSVGEHRPMADSMEGDGFDGGGDRQIPMPESDDEFSRLRAKIRGVLQDPAFSEEYLGQALEELQERVPTARSRPVAAKVAVGEHARQTPPHPKNDIGGKTASVDKEDRAEQELDMLWAHVEGKGVGDIDLFAEDPFGTDTRNLRRKAPVNLFTDEEKAELAQLERDDGARADSILKYI